MQKAAVTTSPNATCTSLNDDNNKITITTVGIYVINKKLITNSSNNNNKNNKYCNNNSKTFTILITIEKSQHLCVIDLISQSLKLLTRHVAYCELLAICLDTNLLPTSKNCKLWRHQQQ
ncbi:hypothetical protein DOY81_009423 [Sarcophaga bullata]|nr:hypothetical protein DOY81_009423 [Sarcophaga bullata]